MIELAEVFKSYLGRTVLHDVGFVAEPGRVTGLLGPNGAGKSTALRILLGLAQPDSGRALLGGRPAAGLQRPMCEVGALLDAGAVHPRRSARAHLRILAATHGIERTRVDEVLEMVGLATVATRSVGGFSLGMRQRLGLAVAHLGDPAIIILDEPLNGLDAEGIHWLRGHLRRLAAEGRTVLISSHLMEEVSRVADQIVILGRGRLLFQGATDDLLNGSTRTVRLRCDEPARVAEALRGAGATVTEEDGALSVRGRSAREIGSLALRLAVVIEELTPIRPSLEEIYLALTQSSVEFRSQPDPLPTVEVPA
jgi:ABC-2 type transport system ATP-binding protein